MMTYYLVIYNQIKLQNLKFLIIYIAYYIEYVTSRPTWDKHWARVFIIGVQNFKLRRERGGSFCIVDSAIK